MRVSDWRALLSAFAEGRLSADAFRRRFLEAMEAAETRRVGVPAAVQELFFVVEAYAGDPTGRGHAVTDDVQLARAVDSALAALGPDAARDAEASPPARIIVLSAGGGGEQRTAFRAGGFPPGAVRLGCAAALAYVAIGIAQFFAVAAQIDSVLGLGPAPSTILAAPLAFIPAIGSVIAFFGAKDVWRWPWTIAAFVFLAIPAATYLSGWFGWRRA